MHLFSHAWFTFCSHASFVFLTLLLVGPPLWSRLAYWMGCVEFCLQMFMGWNFNFVSLSEYITWLAMKFDKRLQCYLDYESDCGDSLSFHLSPLGQINDKTPATLMIFPSAPALCFWSN